MIWKKDNARGFAWFALIAVAAALAVMIVIATTSLLPRIASISSHGGISRPALYSTAAAAPRVLSSTAPRASSEASTTTAKAAPKLSNSPPSSPRPFSGVSAAPLPTVQTSTISVAASSSFSSSLAASYQLPPEASVNPDAIVGILCYFNVTVTDTQNGESAAGSQEEVRGSGVIIDPRGYILTNRHVVAQPEATTTAVDADGNTVPAVVDYSLDHCEIGQVAAGSHLPTPSEIESLNPYIQVPVLGYTAQPVYISTTTSSPSGLSANEASIADFAILTVTGVTKAGSTFGVTSVPSLFPYAELFPGAQYLLPGTQVVTYGFPGDVTAGQGNAFSTLTMTGSVGTVTEIEVGDQFYADTPLVILTDMEVAHGRSGSPLFWRGYVVGLITFYTGDNRTSSGSVASEAILKTLRATAYDPLYDKE